MIHNTALYNTRRIINNEDDNGEEALQKVEETVKSMKLKHRLGKSYKRKSLSRERMEQ